MSYTIKPLNPGPRYGVYDSEGHLVPDEESDFPVYLIFKAKGEAEAAVRKLKKPGPSRARSRHRAMVMDGWKDSRFNLPEHWTTTVDGYVCNVREVSGAKGRHFQWEVRKGDERYIGDAPKAKREKARVNAAKLAEGVAKALSSVLGGGELQRVARKRKPSTRKKTGESQPSRGNSRT